MKAETLFLLVILSGALKGGLHEELSDVYGESGANLCPIIMMDLSRKSPNASSTCGDNNVTQYCYSVDSRLRCSMCENESEVNVRNAVDSDPDSHWISRPGLETVNLTVNLMQPIQVTYIILHTSGNFLSKVPAKWEIHKSIDDGKSFRPWIYFANSSSLCPDGIKNDGVPNENHIACHDDPSINDASAFISLPNNQVTNQLSECGAYKNQFMRDFSYVTNIRLVFLETDIDRVENASQVFYTVSNLHIDGLCVCNGYADSCTVDHVTGLYQCNCSNGTCGQHCEQCCPLFNNAPYIGYGTGCDECNCSGNAESCEYNETLGMGVCISCKNNTSGINCEHCLPQYYLDPQSKSCLPCRCNDNGTVDDGLCDEMGQCNCKEGYLVGLKCDHCPSGTFHVEGNCSDCRCPTNSSGLQFSCDPFSGQCACPPSTTGLRCDVCANDTWGLDMDHHCKPCNCDAVGAIGTDCDNSTGQCSCRDGHTGRDCSQCEDTYYWDGSKCVPCNCNTDGSQDLNCNSTTGKCTCKEHVEGQTCSQCEEGYYNLTAENNCLSCSCDDIGSTSHVCDNVTGQCDCQPERSGRTCRDCKTGYYIDTQTLLCLPCGCSENGSTSRSCSEDGQCTCKDGVTGEKCNRCAIGYWGLDADGCKGCDCFYDGTNRTRICDPVNGQCVCVEGIGGARCTQCEGMGHFIIRNGTCIACGGCSQALIDRLLLLVDNMQSAINFLSESDIVCNSNQFNQLRNKALSVMREVMEWSSIVNASLCRLDIDVYCKTVIEMSSILRNYTRLSELIVELESFFPKLNDDVDEIFKLTKQTFVAITQFETDVFVAYNNTEAELNKTTQVLSEVTEQWMSIEQLLSDSQTTLVTIIERNAYFNNISNTVDQALNNSKIRNDNSEVFLQNRTQENITVHGISNQLKMLQAVLEDIYSLSSNVSSTVNNTLVYNRNLNKNITRLQTILNTTAILNETIGTALNETWELYDDVYAMWEEAELLLQNITDIMEMLDLTVLPCAINETESFQNGLDGLRDLITRAHNHSTNLMTNSSLIIDNSIYWLEYGGRFLVNISNLLSSRNFTEMHLDINNTLAIAQDAIEKISGANLTSLKMKATHLNNESNLLSQQVAGLSSEIQKRKKEADGVHNDTSKFKDSVVAEHSEVATLQTKVKSLNETVQKVWKLIRDNKEPTLTKSNESLNNLMSVADIVKNKILLVEANNNDTADNMQLTDNNLEEINKIDTNLTILSMNVFSSINTFTRDIDGLISKNKIMTNEIDAIIQGLSDIHQEINQMNGRLRLTAKNGMGPFISLQPPPGRTLTGTTQYETIDLFLESGEISNNTLLFYAGPAKAKDEENDEILQQSDYMALLLQKSPVDNDINELTLVYKLSDNVDAQQLTLRGYEFKEEVDYQVQISRVGSAFRLAVPSGEEIYQTSFVNGSLLFTGNSQTAFYIGGKPSDVELPSLVNSTSHYSGVVSLLLYNGQIWGLWDVRDAFSADFTDELNKNDFISNSFDETFEMNSDFALSFTGDGYLHTESLFSSSHGTILTVTVKSYNTEGLVMYAYDGQASLEIYYSKSNLFIVFNGNESRSFKSSPGETVTLSILFDTNNKPIFINIQQSFIQLTLSVGFADFTKTKSWFGGINDDARHLGITQMKPFFGCMIVDLDQPGIILKTEHFVKYYINSSIQKRLSLACLNIQYAHSASFNGSGKIEFDASSFSDDIDENFNSFSFEFAIDPDQPNTGLLYANTKSGSLSIILFNYSIHVTLYDHNDVKVHLNSSRQLEPGTIHFLLLNLNYKSGYQLYIDDYLAASANLFANEWRLDLFRSTESPRLVLGAADDQDTLPYFKGCMKNFAIQFRTFSFLSPKISGIAGVTYHTCNLLESPREQPLLAVATAEPAIDRCPPAMTSFSTVTLSGIQSCYVPQLTDEYNFTIQAIPQRPNGLLLALINSTNLVYAIGTREGKGHYYANKTTEEFGGVCPLLITVNIRSHDDIIMITGSVSVNITQSGPFTLNIGRLPEDAVNDNNFLQCDGCKCPPGFLGELEIQEIDLDYLANSTEHSECKLNTQ